MFRGCCCDKKDGPCSADPSVFIVINANGPLASSTRTARSTSMHLQYGCGWDVGKLSDDGNILLDGGFSEWPAYDDNIYDPEDDCHFCCLPNVGPWGESLLYTNELLGTGSSNRRNSPFKMTKERCQSLFNGYCLEEDEDEDECIRWSRNGNTNRATGCNYWSANEYWDANSGPLIYDHDHPQDRFSAYGAMNERSVGNIFHRYNEYQIFNSEHSPFCLMNEDTIHPKVSAEKYQINNEFVDEDGKVRIGMECIVDYKVGLPGISTFMPSYLNDEKLDTIEISIINTYDFDREEEGYDENEEEDVLKYKDVIISYVEKIISHLFDLYDNGYDITKKIGVDIWRDGVTKSLPPTDDYGAITQWIETNYTPIDDGIDEDDENNEPLSLTKVVDYHNSLNTDNNLLCFMFAAEMVGRDSDYNQVVPGPAQHNHQHSENDIRETQDIIDLIDKEIESTYYIIPKDNNNTAGYWPHDAINPMPYSILLSAPNGNFLKTGYTGSNGFMHPNQDCDDYDLLRLMIIDSKKFFPLETSCINSCDGGREEYIERYNIEELYQNNTNIKYPGGCSFTSPDCYELPILHFDATNHNKCASSASPPHYDESVKNNEEIAEEIINSIEHRFGPQILSNGEMNPYPQNIIFSVNQEDYFLTGGYEETGVISSNIAKGISNWWLYPSLNVVPTYSELYKILKEKFKEQWGEEITEIKFNSCDGNCFHLCESNNGKKKKDNLDMCNWDRNCQKEDPLSESIEPYEVMGNIWWDQPGRWGTKPNNVIYSSSSRTGWHNNSKNSIPILNLVELYQEKFFISPGTYGLSGEAVRMDERKNPCHCDSTKVENANQYFENIVFPDDMNVVKELFHTPIDPTSNYLNCINNSFVKFNSDISGMRMFMPENQQAYKIPEIDYNDYLCYGEAGLGTSYAWLANFNPGKYLAPPPVDLVSAHSINGSFGVSFYDNWMKSIRRGVAYFPIDCTSGTKFSHDRYASRILPYEKWEELTGEPWPTFLTDNYDPPVMGEEWFALKTALYTSNTYNRLPHYPYLYGAESSCIDCGGPECGDPYCIPHFWSNSYIEALGLNSDPGSDDYFYGPNGFNPELDLIRLDACAFPTDVVGGAGRHLIGIPPYLYEGGWYWYYGNPLNSNMDVDHIGFLEWPIPEGSHCSYEYYSDTQETYCLSNRNSMFWNTGNGFHYWGSSYWNPNSECFIEDCPLPNTWCQTGDNDGDGERNLIRSECDSIGGIFVPNVHPTEPPSLMGACCQPSGSCFENEQDNCGSDWKGPFIRCWDDPC